MNDTEMDDNDSHDTDDACPDCGRVFNCVCGTPEGCEVCLLYGEVQCSEHGPACIEAMREGDERQRIEEAIETILSLRDLRSGTAWTRLVVAAKQVQREAGAIDDSQQTSEVP